MNKKIILEIFVAVIIVIILLTVPKLMNPKENKIINMTIGTIEETISIATFNIQIFGQSKSSKSDIMTILAEMVSIYDVIAIQEIRNKSGIVMPRFMEYLPEYSYVIGPRLGRSSSKEQYAFVYNPKTIEFIDEYTFLDEEDVFEREPMSAYFKVRNGNFDFVLTNIHIKPSDATNEIYELSLITEEIQSYFDEQDVIFLGDFNADGTYYNENNLKDLFTDYIIIIDNNIDTTVAKSDNTYDRIIAYNTIKEDYTGRFNVVKFEDKAISDHYLISSDFYSFRDTD